MMGPYTQDLILNQKKKIAAPFPKTNKIIKSSQVFIEKGAKIEHCIINASTGPVYIGKNAEIMEGGIIRGPLAMGEGACLKMGTKVLWRYYDSALFALLVAKSKTPSCLAIPIRHMMDIWVIQ